MEVDWRRKTEIIALFIFNCIDKKIDCKLKNHIWQSRFLDTCLNFFNLLYIVQLLFSISMFNFSLKMLYVSANCQYIQITMDINYYLIGCIVYGAHSCFVIAIQFPFIIQSHIYIWIPSLS